MPQADLQPQSEAQFALRRLLRKASSVARRELHESGIWLGEYPPFGLPPISDVIARAESFTLPVLRARVSATQAAKAENPKSFLIQRHEDAVADLDRVVQDLAVVKQSVASLESFSSLRREETVGGAWHLMDAEANYFLPCADVSGDPFDKSWILRLRGKSVTLPFREGFADLQFLMKYPGHRFTASQMHNVDVVVNHDRGGVEGLESGFYFDPGSENLRKMIDERLCRAQAAILNADLNLGIYFSPNLVRGRYFCFKDVTTEWKVSV